MTKTRPDAGRLIDNAILATWRGYHEFEAGFPSGEMPAFSFFAANGGDFKGLQHPTRAITLDYAAVTRQSLPGLPRDSWRAWACRAGRKRCACCHAAEPR